MVNDFHPKCIRHVPPMGGQANIDPPPSSQSFFFFPLFLLLFPPEQGRWESIENQGKRWKISWSWNVPDWTFTSKGTSETEGETDTPVTRTLKPGPRGCEAANWGEESEGGCWLLRWRMRGQKQYRWMGQISDLLLTQPDTWTGRLSRVQHCCFLTIL